MFVNLPKLSVCQELGGSLDSLLMPTFAARAANCSWIITFQFQRRPVLPHNHGVNIAPAEGKLGVLIPGLGAVTTTFIAGIEAIRRGRCKPIGSLTQLATIRLGKRTENLRRDLSMSGFRSLSLRYHLGGQYNLRDHHFGAADERYRKAHVGDARKGRSVNQLSVAHNVDAAPTGW